MAIAINTASDIANLVLTAYIRGKSFAQTTQDKPLLRVLREKQKTFASGKDSVSVAVKGTFMSDTAGFFAGFNQSDQVTFTQSDNVLRAAYTWRELHAGLVITETELKDSGISIVDSMKPSEHSGAELNRLSNVLEERLADFGESYARKFNEMLWKDGTQDSKAIAGIGALITTNPTTGTKGGLNSATYTWWRNRASTGLVPSADNQTITQKLRDEIIQLRRYGGKPDIACVGSDFMNGLQTEATAKGNYTLSGFTSITDIGIMGVQLDGLKFVYDPSLDDLGRSKYCYILDSSKIGLYTMEGEDNRVRTPERPYDQFVFLRSITYTGALVSNQLNAHGVYTMA